MLNLFCGRGYSCGMQAWWLWNRGEEIYQERNGGREVKEVDFQRLARYRWVKVEFSVAAVLHFKEWSSCHEQYF